MNTDTKKCIKYSKKGKGEMIMNDEAWFIVRNTPGVTGFIGSSGKGAKPYIFYSITKNIKMSTISCKYYTCHRYYCYFYNIKFNIFSCNINIYNN